MFAYLRYPNQLYGKGHSSNLLTQLKRPVEILKPWQTTLPVGCGAQLMPHTMHRKPTLVQSLHMPVLTP